MKTNITTTVYTEQELERALERRCSRIVFEGTKAAAIVAKLEAADAKKRKTRNTGIFLTILMLAATPFTGGASLL